MVKSSNSQSEFTTFAIKDVEILDHRIVYQGYFRVEKFRLRHRLFKGGWSDIFAREVFERGHAVAVLPYDPILNKIVLIEQFRIGALARSESPWLLELVAGIIDLDEQAEQVVARELQEEVGLSAFDVIPMMEYWVSPGGTTEKVALFCARVDASQACGIHGLVEENEDIKVQSFEIKEVYDLLANGHICNAATIIAVQWFQLHEAKVRQQWHIR